MNNDVNTIELADLSFACYLFKWVSKNNKEINTFRIDIDGNFNRKNDEHYEKLIKWLRKWGCRQFKKPVLKNQ